MRDAACAARPACRFQHGERHGERSAPQRDDRAVPVGSEEDRALDPLTDSQVDSPGDAWSEWHRHQLAALAQHRQRAMAALQTEGLDVGADRLRHAQPVQRQQRHQRMIAWRRQSGGDVDRTQLVAVQVGDGDS